MSSCICPECKGCTQVLDVEDADRCGLCQVGLHQSTPTGVEKPVRLRSPDWQ